MAVTMTFWTVRPVRAGRILVWLATTSPHVAVAPAGIANDQKERT